MSCGLLKQVWRVVLLHEAMNAVIQKASHNVNRWQMALR